MKLNHINLGVTDVPVTVALFQDHFGFKPAGESMPMNDRMAFMRDDAGSLISVFKAKDVAYPKVFHIGFMQDTPQQVRDMHRQLTDAGFTIPEPHENNGRLTFYFDTPGGFVLEVESFFD